MRSGKNRLAIALTLMVGVLTSGAAPALAQPGDEGDRHPIVGSWQVTAEVGDYTFHVLYTFTSDGNLLVTVDDGRNGNGAWEATAPGEVTMTFLIQGVDESGALRVERLRERVILPGTTDVDTFDGHFLYQLEDAEGAVLDALAGTVTARRIDVEAPPDA